MRIGKYSVATRAAEQIGGQGKFVGIASLVWDEGDSTWETSINFHRSFDTPAEAAAHAQQQIEIRVRDGVL